MSVRKAILDYNNDGRKQSQTFAVEAGQECSRQALRIRKSKSAVTTIGIAQTHSYRRERTFE